MADFNINPAAPTVAVSDAGGTYSGTSFAASATVAGLNDTPTASLEGIAPSLVYYAGTFTEAAQLAGLTALSGAPIGVGSYTVLADFGGSADYSAAEALANFGISPAAPTLSVSDPGGTYDASAFPASASVAGVSGPAGLSLEGVAPSLTYYVGTYASVSLLASLTSLAGAPTATGTYTVLAAFPGSADYDVAEAMASFSITQATPTLDVIAPSGTYNGSAIRASANVAGASGEAGAALEGVAPTLVYYLGTYNSVSQLAGLSALPGAPIQAGSYTRPGRFPRQYRLRDRDRAGRLPASARRRRRWTSSRTAGPMTVRALEPRRAWRA